ncbi:hypothetical protein [Helicobacter ailurogastricus]|uniref:hypothetical protein n=1 Tax=Helicobacter ailurogastricus TaxID=1578720 RepID=UPI00244D8243|nr:hypothetical protein [Helicobacter ailurogastricus]GMB92254.1 hypothetical protein NHP190009_14400 [Helicobacter ailurogastricus]
MFDITSTEDITSYALRLQEIKEKMKKAGLLGLFEEALEIQEGFKNLLALSNKNKKMLIAELEGKRPVGRPRKVLLGATTATHTRVVQQAQREQEATQINQVATAIQEKDAQRGQGIAKNEASLQAQGQDTQALQTPQSTTQDTQTEQQQELGTSKSSNPKEPQKTRGRKPKKG